MTVAEAEGAAEPGGSIWELEEQTENDWKGQRIEMKFPPCLKLPGPQRLSCPRQDNPFRIHK